jgi:hypothetical protein
MTESSQHRTPIQGLLDWVDSTSAQLSEFGARARSIVVRVPESQAEVGFILKPRVGGPRPKLNLNISGQGVRGARLVETPEHVDRSEQIQIDDDALQIDFGGFSPSSDTFMMTLDRDVGSEDRFTSLVSRTWKRDSEVHKADEPERYWIYAALKDPSLLETKYGNVDLRDFEVSVDIGIYERLRAALPPSFVRRTDALLRFVRERERGRRVRSMLEYSRLRGSGGSSDDIAKIAELRMLFTTNGFRDFVEVSKPFRYSSAAPAIGAATLEDVFDIPKFVEVGARTNLDVRHPTAKGDLVYRARALLDKCHSVLSP